MWGWLSPSPCPLVGLWQDSLSVNGQPGCIWLRMSRVRWEPGCRGAVRIVPLWSDKHCKLLVECLGLIYESFCRWEDQKREGGMLDISNTLVIGIVLQPLVPPVAWGKFQIEFALRACNIFTAFRNADTSPSCKADRFCSPASTWTVQNSLDNADRLVPFRLLPFRLLPFRLLYTTRCHFASWNKLYKFMK